ARPAQRCLETAPDLFWSALPQSGMLNRGAQCFLRFEFGNALRAREQVLLKFSRASRVEFAVEIAVKNGVRHFTTHVGPPDSSWVRPGSRNAATADGPGKEPTSRCQSALK